MSNSSFNTNSYVNAQLAPTLRNSVSQTLERAEAEINQIPVRKRKRTQLFV